MFAAKLSRWLGNSPKSGGLRAMATIPGLSTGRAHSMESLRCAHRLVWHVLAWFAMSLGAAIASLATHPQALELICSASHGIKMVAHGDTGTPGAGHHIGDCPLCVTVGAPPPVAAACVPFAAPVHATTLPVAAYVAALAVAPPPARGPPSV